MSAGCSRHDELRAEPYFYRRCLICGEELRTPWGPETHLESAYLLRTHVINHSRNELADYALREALRGV